MPRCRRPRRLRAGRCPASTRAVTVPPDTVTSVSGLAPMMPSTAIRPAVGVADREGAREAAQVGALRARCRRGRARARPCRPRGPRSPRGRAHRVLVAGGSCAPGPERRRPVGAVVDGLPVGLGRRARRRRASMRVIHERPARRPTITRGTISTLGASRPVVEGEGAEAHEPGARQARPRHRRSTRPRAPASVRRTAARAASARSPGDPFSSPVERRPDAGDAVAAAHPVQRGIGVGVGQHVVDGVDRRVVTRSRGTSAGAGSVTPPA